jgi:drug/metabolite transporter (DMT)-like permease
LALALLLLLGTLWGATFTAAKIAVTGGVTPAGYVFWQIGGSGAVLMAVALLRRRPPPIDGRHLVYYLVSGGIGLALPNFIIMTVIARLPSGIAAIVINTAPLLTYVFAVLLAFQRFRWIRMAGFISGLAGIAVMVVPRASLPDPAMAPWILVELLAPCAYSLSNLFIERHRPLGTDSFTLVAGSLAVASIFVVPPVVALGETHLFAWPLRPADLAVLLQVAISCVAYGLMFELVRLAGAVYFSQVGYVVSLTALGWGALLFGERHSLWIWVAVGLILVGLALVNRRDRRAA